MQRYDTFDAEDIGVKESVRRVDEAFRKAGYEPERIWWFDRARLPVVSPISSTSRTSLIS